VPLVPALTETVSEVAVMVDDSGICHAYAEEFMFKCWGYMPDFSWRWTGDQKYANIAMLPSERC